MIKKLIIKSSKNFLLEANSQVWTQISPEVLPLEPSPGPAPIHPLLESSLLPLSLSLYQIYCQPTDAGLDKARHRWRNQGGQGQILLIPDYFGTFKVCEISEISWSHQGFLGSSTYDIHVLMLCRKFELILIKI